MQSLESILRESAKRHKHLCPRQVLGARMSLLAAESLELDLPRADKRLLVIAETDGCTVDGIIAATGCHVGGRTLRIFDFGKVAATFIDIYTEKSIRILPRREARSIAVDRMPGARNDWQAMLTSYQVMPTSDLLLAQHVRLTLPLSQMISRPSARTVCDICEEEIINGREILDHDVVLCRACAGEGYYHFVESFDRERRETSPSDQYP